MLNVCFGDSECGALKHALRDEQVTFSYRALELGGIHPDYFDEARKEWMNQTRYRQEKELILTRILRKKGDK